MARSARFSLAPPVNSAWFQCASVIDDEHSRALREFLSTYLVETRDNPALSRSVPIVDRFMRD